MATKPYLFWGDTHASSDSDLGIFGSGAPETVAATTTAAGGTAVVSPDLGPATVVARPRLRRSSSVSGKQQQQQAGTKKLPQRGLGVAELERLRCGGDPLRDLSAAVVVDAAGAQGHPLLHYHHLQIPVPPSAFEAAAGARYGSQLLAPAPPTPTPPGPVCFLHPPAAADCQRACLLVAPEQQYFRDRWGRMGAFSPAGDGADHQRQLLPAPMAPEHPSSQSTIWRPAASSSSCLHTGHRCDLCCRRMRALAPMPPESPNAGSNTNNTMPDYSIYDLAAAMATARQGASFLPLDTRQRGVVAAEAPAKKEVREIEFFPAASANHTGGGGRVPVPDESELEAPFSSPYAGRTAPQLDLSLRL